MSETFYQFFVDLVELKVGLIMYKARMNKLPCNVQAKFTTNILV